MRLLLGPPGSGKSTLILDEIRARLRLPWPGVLLIVPSATMAEHVRNQLARGGLPVRRDSVITLARFLDAIVPDLAPAQPCDLELLSAHVLETLRPAGFSRLSDSPGLPAVVAAAVEELANAGCDALQLAALRRLNTWSGPVLESLCTVQEEIEKELKRHGLHTRAARLAEASARVKRGLGLDADRVYVDGFFTLNRGEVDLVRALSTRAGVTVALPEWPGASAARERLLSGDCEEARLHPRRTLPSTHLRPGATRDRELEGIAERLRELHAAGTPWRDCVVITRAEEPYVHHIETVLARFGIPSRSYFAQPLLSHPVARVFAAAVKGFLGGWEHGAVLDALRSPVTCAGGSVAFPGFENAVRAALPGSGLAPLRSLAAATPGAEAVVESLDTLGALSEAWRKPCAAAMWVERLASLRALLASPEQIAAVDAHTRRAWRARAAAIAEFGPALAPVTRLFGDRPIPLDRFWAGAQPALQAASLRVTDHRRNAVALIDAHEARQWEAPVVFVCGLVEGDFPKRTQPEPLLGADLRRRLNEHGFPVGTVEEKEQEEDFLFRFAMTRATGELNLSWPRFNEKGDPLLPSFLVREAHGVEVALRHVRVRPARVAPPLMAQSIDDPRLREHLAQRYERHNTTALEDFLQCAFRFHAGHTLALEGLAPLPGERLDVMLKGTVIHRVLNEWHKKGGGIEAVFESVWRRTLQKERVPAGHRRELERAAMLRSLRAYAAAPRVEPGWRVYVEQPFSLDLADCAIEGRIDRYDVNDASQVRLFEFKYSGAPGAKKRLQKLRAGLLLQGGLYPLALRREGLEPVSFEYWALRGRSESAGETTPEGLERIIELSRATAETAAARILGGEIAVQPADLEMCERCDFAAACRFNQAAAAMIAASGAPAQAGSGNT